MSLGWLGQSRLRGDCASGGPCKLEEMWGKQVQGEKTAGQRVAAKKGRVRLRRAELFHVARLQCRGGWGGKRGVREGGKWGGVREEPQRSGKGPGSPLSHLSSKLPSGVGAKVSDDKAHFADDKIEALTHYRDSLFLCLGS